MKLLISLLILKTVPLFSQELENYMVCDVDIIKDGQIVSSHKVTTYSPLKIAGDTSSAYHSSATAVSSCKLQAFNKKYNKKNIFKDGKSFIDLCYKIGNGVSLDRDGHAEFYLVKRPLKDIFLFGYLNRDNPLVLNGTEQKNQKINKHFELDANCENKHLLPTDNLWSEIKDEYTI